MPICRAGAKLIYFAHVPKCGGTAVERYLAKRFGKLGFWDEAYAQRDPASAWTISPPQHVLEVVRRDLLPDRLFDAQFATVRHPATRLRSMFRFQRDIENALPPNTRFRSWIEGLPRTLATAPYALHGHPRLMSDYVPKQAQVFRMEEGLDQIIPWIEALIGEEPSDPPETLPRVNELERRLPPEVVNRPPVLLDEANLALIADIYASDYDRFGYDIAPPEQTS
ncbi:sulfotransferase family 2 domain-containing protein [Tropicibacter sp. R15_0]|uniref:sulfotransferase family 2 domain-containing protein n=1 Tax=Tropicibacter sp. R15_0 TaxID=2821101 RepID=UPI001ADB650B|nr:sulfotransferase family 2 domain-containing protein [Tropicibacter sp. R15_0]MBO9468075.1 sulfotransferase family 2 domain-containing protein [Tropicibacter sp. R15_0]